MSAFPVPVIVRDGKAEALKQIALSRTSQASTPSDDTYDEDCLQTLVYEHPSMLPVTEIDPAVTKLIPVCREMQTPAGPIDVVFLTPDGRPVIVEVKLWRNPEARRKVLAQILDYAKDLSHWTFDQFDQAVRRARRQEDGESPRGLTELAGLQENSEDAARFHDAVNRRLRRGEMLLLIIGDGIRENVGAMTRFLEDHGALHFTFGLVEVAIFQLPDGGRLVQPRILAQSVLVKRFVLDVRNDSIDVRQPETEESQSRGEGAASGPEVNAELQAWKTSNQTFWKGFLDHLRLDDRTQDKKPATTGTNQNFDLTGCSGAWVSAFLAAARNIAGVYLTFPAGVLGDRMYGSLESDKQAIEDAIGLPLKWLSDRGRKYIQATYAYAPGDPFEGRAEPIQRTLADWTNRFINEFRPRLEQISRESA